MTVGASVDDGADLVVTPLACVVVGPLRTRMMVRMTATMANMARAPARTPMIIRFEDSGARATREPSSAGLSAIP